MPPGFHDAIHSKVPALLISGALDPVTPPESSAETARNLSASQVVVIKDGTHGTGSACVDGVIGRFIDTAAKVDASCVEGMKLGPWLTKMP